MASASSCHTHGHSCVVLNFICKAGSCAVPRFCGSVPVVFGDSLVIVTMTLAHLTITSQRLCFLTTRCLGTTLELKTRF